MNSKLDQAAPAIDKSFLNVLTNHRRGSIVSDVSAAIKQATSAVQLTGKSAKVMLVMTLKPASAGAKGTLIFEPKVKTTIPEVEAAGSIFYADADFNLVREDPDQKTLTLVEPAKAAPASELREVEA